MTDRRNFIKTAGVVGVGGLAGCIGPLQNDDPEPEEPENETTDNTEDDGGNEAETAGPTTVTVRIENVSDTDAYGDDTHTGGQIWLTPGAYAVHEGDNPVLTEGEEATVGLEALAEAGFPDGFEGETGLVGELSPEDNDGVVDAGAFTPEDTVEDPNDPMEAVPGAPPIAPGGAFEFDVEVSPGQNFSFATMFVPSNDLFYAPASSGITLWPEDGEVVSGDVTDDVELWDAGTETNSEPGVGPDQAPAQDGPDVGEDEGGTVQLAADVDDGFNYPSVDSVVQVTVTPVEE